MYVTRATLERAPAEDVLKAFWLLGDEVVRRIRNYAENATTPVALLDGIQFAGAAKSIQIRFSHGSENWPYDLHNAVERASSSSARGPGSRFCTSGRFFAPSGLRSLISAGSTSARRAFVASCQTPRAGSRKSLRHLKIRSSNALNLRDVFSGSFTGVLEVEDLDRVDPPRLAVAVFDVKQLIVLQRCLVRLREVFDVCLHDESDPVAQSDPYWHGSGDDQAYYQRAAIANFGQIFVFPALSSLTVGRIESFLPSFGYVNPGTCS